MFTRAFTRNFFFRRGSSSSETPTVRKQHKLKSRSRSRSADPEPESRHAKNILQPSSQNVAASDQHTALVENDKELKSESSSQNLARREEQDENCPVAAGTPVAPPEPAYTPLDGLEHAKVNLNLDSAAHDASGSFILVGNSAVEIELQNTEELGEEETFQTPYLGTDEIMPPTPTCAFVVQQTVNSPIVELLVQAPCSSSVFPNGEDSSGTGRRISSPQLAQISSDEEPCIVSLQTAILSDITEAEEPAPESDVPGTIVDDDIVSEADTEARHTVLSFDSFGSSYASTECPKVSGSPAELELASPALTGLDNVTQETSQGVEPPSSTDSVGASQDCGLLECTPPVSMSLASMSDAGEDQGFDTALAGEPLDSQSVCASVTSTLEIITTRISESKDTIPALRNPSSMTQGQHGTVPAPTEVQADTPGIPTAVTYADAMNLALKHPDMSARILNEPLASTCTSACPSPARTASPICGSAFSVKKADCSEPDSAPLPKTTPNVELKKQAPAHTAERPNWALAPDEPKPARKPRSCGSTRDTPTRGDSREARRRNRGPHVGKADVVPSVTPTPSTKLSGTDASVVQPTPKKRLVPDEDSPRSMRKEKAEPWLRRVGSWIEETSKTPQVCPNTTGTCPNLSETPMASETPESASGSAAVGQVPHPAKETATPIPRSTTSLNPCAVAWEPRQRAATVGSATGALSPVAVSASNTLGTRGDATPECTRVDTVRDDSLRPGGVVSKNPQQERSAQNVLAGTQVGANVGTSQNNLQGTFPPLVAPTGTLGGMTRQRTQPHAPFGQQASWSTRILETQLPQSSQHTVPPMKPPASIALPAGEPTILYLATPVSGPSQLQLASETALTSPPYRPGGLGSSYTVRLPSPGPPETGPSRPIPIMRPPVTVRFTAPPGSLSRAPQVALAPTLANRQPGAALAMAVPSASSPAAPAPPGSGRPPAATVGTAAAPSQTMRFYGIETPQVVFDKHGWTVNN